MAPWKRGLGRFAIATAASILLANCGGGGGGGGNVIVRLFFGMNNDGGCNKVVVDVDLDQARAVLARDGGGDVDCALNQALQNAGCDVEFDEIDGDGRLRVTIDGCTVPAMTNLVQCGFTEVTLSDLREETAAQCVCATAGCDTTPPICISNNSDPGSCEDCDNNEDDDDNGLTDCADPNCEHSPLCDVNPTTTTVIDTTTTVIETTTTTVGDTTTTTTSGGQECTLVFRLTDDVNVGAIEFEVDYSAAGGTMRGTGSGVACTSLVSGALAAFQDDDANEELSVGLVSLSGIDGPADLASCMFDAPAKPDVGDFAIIVTDAADPNLDPIVPSPDVVLTSLECISTGTTTTVVDTTTTTVIGPTTTTVIGPTTTTVGPTTTTTLPGDSVSFGLTQSSAPVGALQFTIDYANAPGEFAGSGASVDCESSVEGALFAPNDNDGARKLTLGLIALDAFSAPTPLVRCNFEATDTIEPGDFVITVNDASDASGEDVDVTIDVSVFNAP